MGAGQIIVLNGVPRSGESSIARAVQETFDGAWINLGVDVARQTTPPGLQPGIGLRPGERGHPVAPLLPTLYAALYESVAAHSQLGLNVVVDIGHHDRAILSDCARRLTGLPALLVGIRCQLQTIVERRQASGMTTEMEPVRRWQEAVHDPGLYDLEVDTSELSPQQCAAAIRERLDAGGPATAFARLARP
jgi:chloramphenicol 3-O phosphotransferase